MTRVASIGTMTKKSVTIGFISLKEAVAKTAKLLLGRSCAEPLTSDELQELVRYAGTHIKAHPRDRRPGRNVVVPKSIRALMNRSRISKQHCDLARRVLNELLRENKIQAIMIGDRGAQVPVPAAQWNEDYFKLAVGLIPSDLMEWDDDVEPEPLFVRILDINKHVKALTRRQKNELVKLNPAFRSAREGVGGRPEKHQWHEIWAQIACWAATGELPETAAALIRKVVDWYPSEYGDITNDDVRPKAEALFRLIGSVKKTASF